MGMNSKDWSSLFLEILRIVVAALAGGGTAAISGSF